MGYFLNLKTGSKLLVSFFLVALISGLVAYLGIKNIKSIDQRDTLMYEKMTIPLVQLANISNNLQQEHINLYQLMAAKTPEEKAVYLEKIKKLRRMMDEHKNQYLKTIIDDTDRRMFNEFVLLRNKSIIMADQAILLSHNGDEERGLFSISDTEDFGKAKMEEEQAIEKLINYNVVSAGKLVQDNSDAAEKAVSIMIAVFATGMILAMITGYLLSRSIVKPLVAMRKMSTQIYQGDFSAADIDTNRQDEIGELIKSFKKMRSGFEGEMNYLAEESNKVILLRNSILYDVMNRQYKSSFDDLDYILNKLIELTESKFGYIYLYDEETKKFSLNSWSKEVMEACKVIDRQTDYELEKTGLWGEVVRQRKPLLVNNFELPNEMKKGYPEGHVELTRFMSIPVIIDEKIVAVVGLANSSKDYDDNDIYQVNAVMAGVWSLLEKKVAQADLEIERNKFYQTLLSIGDGVIVMDNEGKIEIINEIAEKLTGWRAEEAKGMNYRDVFVLSHENAAKKIKDPIEQVFVTGTVQELENHAVLTSKWGHRYHIEDSAAPIKGPDGVTKGVVLVFRDVTDKREQGRILEYLSFHDPLTGLYNRRYFEEELKRFDTPRNYPLTIIMADVNGLKLANDAFGHAVGDRMLIKASEVMSACCRQEDSISRWGGDEFVLLLPRTGEEAAESVVKRIKNKAAAIKQDIGILSIAFGWGTKTSQDEDIYRIFKNAEEYMYQRKASESQRHRSETIKTIMSNIFEKSPIEEFHSKRVAELAIRIAREMKISPREIDSIEMLGFFHDIGKTIFTRELFEKTEILNEEDWKEIRKHPEVGSRIVSCSSETAILSKGILHHHERWDGKGYPSGLKGLQIPINSRIIAVAEAYATMTSDKMYRPAMTKNAAVEEIKKNSGSQFDPSITEVFINICLADEAEFI